MSEASERASERASEWHSKPIYSWLFWPSVKWKVKSFLKDDELVKGEGTREREDRKLWKMEWRGE